MRVTPDLTCLGKVIGGGLPLAAVGGRRELMQLLAPVGPVYQAGTLSGNPLSVACGLATLKGLRDTRGAYERLDELGALAEDALVEAAEEAGVEACVNRVGSMLTLFLDVQSVSGLDDALRASTERFGRYFRGMLGDGVYLPPSQFESLFLSLAHGEADIDLLRPGGGPGTRGLLSGADPPHRSLRALRRRGVRVHRRHRRGRTHRRLAGFQVRDAAMGPPPADAPRRGRRVRPHGPGAPALRPR
jgi:hypothetical protein